MSYYSGDYYQGDYYQGDPFLGALVGMGATWLGKKLLGRGAAAAGKTAIARVGAGAVTGIAGGVLATSAAGLAFGKGKEIFMNITGGQIPMPGGGVFRPGRILPGGVPATSPGCCASGYHWNKSMTSTGAPPGTVCVRNRSMNVANPRALRRSLRRVVGFGKLAARTRKSINAAARAVK